MNDLYWAEDRVRQLKQRKNRCVCKYCGGPLTIKSILFGDVTDARIELYCEQCERIEFGVEPEIYHSAKNFIDQFSFDLFDDIDQPALKHQMNIAKVSDILTWGFQNTGLLNEEGFTVPLNMQDDAWAECMIVDNETLTAFFAHEKENKADKAKEKTEEKAREGTSDAD